MQFEKHIDVSFFEYEIFFNYWMKINNMPDISVQNFLRKENQNYKSVVYTFMTSFDKKDE